jgi:hypothetical protein
MNKLRMTVFAALLVIAILVSNFSASAGRKVNEYEGQHRVAENEYEGQHRVAQAGDPSQWG